MGLRVEVNEVHDSFVVVLLSPRKLKLSPGKHTRPQNRKERNFRGRGDALRTRAGDRKRERRRERRKEGSPRRWRKEEEAIPRFQMRAISIHGGEGGGGEKAGLGGRAA